MKLEVKNINYLHHLLSLLQADGITILEELETERLSKIRSLTDYKTMLKETTSLIEQIVNYLQDFYKN